MPIFQDPDEELIMLQLPEAQNVQILVDEVAFVLKDKLDAREVVEFKLMLEQRIREAAAGAAELDGSSGDKDDNDHDNDEEDSDENHIDAKRKLSGKSVPTPLPSVEDVLGNVEVDTDSIVIPEMARSATWNPRKVNEVILDREMVREYSYDCYAIGG
jgi:hypothetical protein